MKINIIYLHNKKFILDFLLPQNSYDKIFFPSLDKIWFPKAGHN